MGEVPGRPVGPRSPFLRAGWRERHCPQSARGGAGHTAQTLDSGLQGTLDPAQKSLRQDLTLVKDMLDLIIFFHFLFLKITVNIQYIVSLYILDIVTAGLSSPSSITWRQFSNLVERGRKHP